MGEKDLINKILKATIASVEIEEENLTDSCGLYSIEDYFNYSDGLLDKIESEAIDLHLRECPLCRSGLERAKDIMKQAKKIGATIDNNDLIQAAQARMKDEEEGISWAAKSEQPGYNGEALGIAVSEEEDKAIIITLKTYVDKKLDEEEGVYIIGDRRGKKQAPIDDHEERLKTLFMSIPHLRAFNLHRRYVSIDTGEIYLKKTLSLSLAIVISLINALYKGKDMPITVYSALVNPDGTLDPTEGIATKLSAAKDSGARCFLLSSENRCDVPDVLLDDPELEVLFFDHLDQVLRFIGVPPIPAIEDEDETLACDSHSTDYEGIENESGWEAFANLVEESGADARFARRLFPFLEGLCCKKPVGKDRVIILVIGDIKKIDEALPSAGMEVPKDTSIFAMENTFHEMTGLFHGEKFAFVIGNNGKLHAVRMTDVEIKGDLDVNPVLTGRNKRLAAISMLAGSIVFSVSQSDRLINMFKSGELPVRYSNGRWQATHYKSFSNLLMRVLISQDILDIEISEAAIFKTAGASIKAAEKGVSCIFAIGAEGKKDNAGLLISPISDSKIHIKPVPINSLASEDLFNFAADNRAILVDRSGGVRFGEINRPFLRSTSSTHQVLENNHELGRQYSKLTKAIVIVTSGTGRITLYGNGEELICL